MKKLLSSPRHRLALIFVVVTLLAEGECSKVPYDWIYNENDSLLGCYYPDYGNPTITEVSSFDGSLKHPSVATYYFIGENRAWLIRTPSQNSRLRMYFSYLDIDDRSYFDSVTIYDGPDATSPTVARICSDNHLNVMYYTTGNVAFVTMTSDYAVQKRGFILKFEAEIGGGTMEPTAGTNEPEMPTTVEVVQETTTETTAAMPITTEHPETTPEITTTFETSETTVMDVTNKETTLEPSSTRLVPTVETTSEAETTQFVTTEPILTTESPKETSEIPETTAWVATFEPSATTLAVETTVAGTTEPMFTTEKPEPTTEILETTSRTTTMEVTFAAVTTEPTTTVVILTNEPTRETSEGPESTVAIITTETTLETSTIEAAVETTLAGTTEPMFTTEQPEPTTEIVETTSSTETAAEITKPSTTEAILTTEKPHETSEVHESTVATVATTERTAVETTEAGTTEHMLTTEQPEPTTEIVETTTEAVTTTEPTITSALETTTEFLTTEVTEVETSTASPTTQSTTSTTTSTTTTTLRTTTTIPFVPMWPRESDLLGFWPLDIKNKLGDITGKRKSCVTCGGVLDSSVKGPFGQASTSYHASNSVILDVKSARSATSTSFTIAMHVRVPKGSTGGLLSFGNSKDKKYIQLDVATSSNKTLASRQILEVFGATTSTMYGQFDVLQPNEWTFLAIVVERLSSTSCMLSIRGRHGTIYRQRSVSNICKDITSYNDINLGYAYTASTSKVTYLNANISVSCLTLYSAALSDAEVRQVHEACRAAHETPTCGAPVITTIPSIPQAQNKTISKRGQFPWMVTLRPTANVNRVLCSAFIIDRFFVVTTASCVSGLGINMLVLVGDYDSSALLENGESYQEIRNVYIHPSYNSINGDVALVELATAIDFTNNYASTICLPEYSASQTLDNSATYYFDGWGENGRSPSGNQALPRYVYGIVLPDATCNAKWSNVDFSPTWFTCFESSVSWAKNVPCSGDEGGPLMVAGRDLRGRELLRPVAIYGKRDSDCSKITPALFTMISPYMDWITQKIACILPGHLYPSSCPL